VLEIGGRGGRGGGRFGGCETRRWKAPRQDDRGQDKMQLVGNFDEYASFSYRRSVTFYFMNFLEQIPHFYLQKAFEVCGILENVFVASKRNVYGELYDFVRFSKVRNVTKLLYALVSVIQK